MEGSVFFIKLEGPSLACIGGVLVEVLEVVGILVGALVVTVIVELIWDWWLSVEHFIFLFFKVINSY